MRAEALLIGILMLSASLAGCFKEDTSPPPPEEPSLPDGIFLTGPDGLNLSLDLYQLLPLSFVFSNVGEDGAEPSIGITSSGCMFFTAFEKVVADMQPGSTINSFHEQAQPSPVAGKKKAADSKNGGEDEAWEEIGW